MSITFSTVYQAVIFFETNDEVSVENSLGLQTLSSNPDLADWSFGPRSPASSPYVEVAGSSRVEVRTLATLIHSKLRQLGVTFVE